METRAAKMTAVCKEGSHLLPLLETLEDSSSSPSEQTDAYLSLVSRLSGEDGKDLMVLVEGQFPRLCKLYKEHISNENSDLGNAALQALGFCVFNSKIASGLSASEIEELFLALNAIAAKGTDKNRCTRALWVISKQNFSSEAVGKAVPSILSTLESVLSREVQSFVIEYEALNVIIRLLEQAPTQMTDEAVRWAKLVIPLVIHSAPKVRLRSATVLEIGMPVLLKKHQEVAAITEQLMSSKIIAEMQKLFASKNETYVLKLWPLFVKLLGKTLHRSGTFINSLLQLEELGFRSGSPTVKKIAFIAWKSLIDNFALNPDILSSTKRLKLLMQPLSSIHVRTEALALTKIEVWWYLLMRLGAQLHLHFEQVCLPLIQSALSTESTPATPLKGSNHSMVVSTPIQKGSNLFASPTTPKINLNSSLLSSVAFPSVHLIGVEMMLHFLLGPEIVKFASHHKLMLNLEPLQHPLISSSSFFCKHAAVLLTSVQDGFIVIGKDASGAVINAIWKDMIDFVKAAMDTGAKKERQGSEVLTCLLQSLKTIITSDFLQVEKSMSLLEYTVKGLPQKVLGSAAYQGTPALFIIQLHFHYKLLDHGITTERFFINLETLVKCVLSGSTSPLAFTEAVLAELNQCARVLENKEALWRMWSMLINPLTDRINQTNEVNQGDALEHNFNAMHSALMLPIAHIFSIPEFPQPSMKTLMRTWSDLYKAFARCAALVTTTEENVCCEELCSRILLVFGEFQSCLPFLERIVQVITVIVDCVNFSPYTTKFQPKTKAPHTPTDWAKRKKEPLGNLSSLLKVIMKSLDCFHTLTSESLPDASSPTLVSIGGSLIGALSTCLSHITLPSLFRTVFVMLTKPISVFYETSKSESSKVYSSLGNKLDKFLADGLQSLSTRYTGSFDSELLTALSPLLCAVFIHKNKQIRNQVAQFWNGSFGKTAGLLYPEELKPVLSQIKSKTPLLLPGFTYSNSSEEFSGIYSDNTDNSHLETKISGIEVKSAGKRDSLLARAEDINDKGTPIRSSQVKAKLDFSSPKRKLQLLEEEPSVEFVFIPPETKERVLTEHQKEVLRTKRVDIPTMYNNLDASQDTTLFSQYSQSQENSSEKTAVPEELEDVAKTKESVSDVLPAEKEICDVENLEADVEMVDAGQPTDITEESTVVETEKSQNISNASNSSTCSDMVVGTPPPPTSRRQSFITLEKFDKSPNRSFSPMPDTKFPKATIVSLVPDSQEATDTECGLINVISVNHKEPSNNNTPKSKRKRPNTTQIEVNCAKKQIPDEFNPDSATGSTTKTEPVEEELVDFIPDSQPQDQEPKTGDAAENAKVGSSASKNKAESKENTPPEPESNSQSEGSQSRPANKVSLRRSSRRQSEILEGVSNENVGQKRDRTMAEEKPPKKGMQPKETSLLQQTEKAEKPQEEKELTKMDPSLQVSLAAEKNAEKTKTPEVKPSEDLPDSKSSKDSQEMTRSRPRYQTRRSLQALKTGTENSESDNSETRDEGGKRKRAARSKSKTADGSEKEEPSERSQPSTMESDSKTETESVKNPEPALDVDLRVDHSVVVEVDDKTYSITTENTCLTTKEFDSEPSLASEPSLCSTEENQTYDASKGDTKPPLCTEKENVTRDITKNDPEHSLSSNVENNTYDIMKNGPEPSISISNLQNTYDVTKHSTVASTMMQSEMTEPSSCDFSTAVSDVFPKTESKLEESPDCPDKKTRRIRRSKSCDCCSEESPKQEKSVTGSPSSEGISVKEKKPLPSISCSEASCANLHFDISVFSGPCAVSTPLDMKASGQCFFIERVAEVKTDTESDQEITVVPVNEGSSQTDVTQVQTKTVVDPELLSVEEQSRAGPVVSETSDALTVGIDIEMNDAQSVDADGEEPSASDLKDATDSCTTPAAATTPSAPNKTDEETEVDRSEDVPDETEAETLKSQDFAQDMEGENGKSQGFAHDMEGDLGKAEDAVPGTDSAVCSASGSDGLVAAENKQLASDCPAVTTEKCADPTESNVTIEHVAEGRADTDSPPKMKGLISLASANDSPGGYSGWSPSASPSTSILKKGLKRQQENDSPSPINKIRRVSFADPIYQEGLADDIDRRSPVIRGHSSNGSPSSRSLKMLTISQPKLNTTPTKGFLSPGSRALGCKSSKKNLISEMTKESMPSPKESVYPALMNCTTSIDVILPQITSNMWARGLGQLIRAKNIKTIGDLSTMTPSEIKTLPIRSPKISNVKKALRGYHEQQTKAKGYDEFAVLGEIEKPLNGIDEKTTSADEEKLATDLIEQPVAAIASTDTTAPLPDVPAQISALSVKLSTEDLNKYSGSQLFEMQEKLMLMSSCILKHLQSQWRSPPHPGSDQ